LTRNVVDGFGPIGVEGRFRFIAERTMSFIQQEKTAALTTLRGLLHDPLIEWKAKDDTNVYDDRSIVKKIGMVESRLNGYNHSVLIPKAGPFSVRGLVAKQIEMAMDEKLLSGMFVGWASYI
jgi:serine/threonine-protein kinase ATR